MALNNLKNTPSRDYHLDFAKGICIILMVIGHSGAPIWLHEWLSTFHMAVFFMASGFLWKLKNIDDINSLLKYIWKKIKSLYIPYVLCNGLFLVLNNFFVIIHIYPETSVLNTYQIITGLLLILLTGNITTLGGATWFLSVLFIITILHAIYSFILKNFKYKNIIDFILVIFCIIMAEVVNQLSLGFVLPLRIGILFSAYILYRLGMIIKIIYNKLKNITIGGGYQLIIVVISLGILIICSIFVGGVELNSGKIVNILYLLFVSICGWVFLWVTASMLHKYINVLCRIIGYFGRNTLPIVLWHFIAMKFVSYIWISTNNLSILSLASFPVINDTTYWFWICYTLGGVFIPILVNIPYKLVKQILYERLKSMLIKSQSSNENSL